MVDLKKNCATRILIQFTDGSEIELLGGDAADIWQEMGDLGFDVDICNTKNGRYRDQRFTVPVSLLPHLNIN